MRTSLTQGVQRQDLRACHPRMQNVADDRDAQRREIALVLADREHIEHRLGRAGVTVAGIDHADPR